MATYDEVASGGIYIEQWPSFWLKYPVDGILRWWPRIRTFYNSVATGGATNGGEAVLGRRFTEPTSGGIKASGYWSNTYNIVASKGVKILKWFTHARVSTTFWPPIGETGVLINGRSLDAAGIFAMGGVKINGMPRRWIVYNTITQLSTGQGVVSGWHTPEPTGIEYVDFFDPTTAAGLIAGAPEGIYGIQPPWGVPIFDGGEFIGLEAVGITVSGYFLEDDPELYAQVIMWPPIEGGIVVGGSIEITGATNIQYPDLVGGLVIGGKVSPTKINYYTPFKSGVGRCFNNDNLVKEYEQDIIDRRKGKIRQFYGEQTVAPMPVCYSHDHNPTWCDMGGVCDGLIPACVKSHQGPFMPARERANSARDRTIARVS